MLALMSPFAPMRLLDNVMADALMHDDLLSDALRRGEPNVRLMSTAPRITDAADKMTISITAPGVSPADLTIEALDGPRIKVRGHTKVEAHSHVVDYTVQLPADADAANASAEAADGLITVSVPKKAAPEPARLPVHTISQPMPDAEQGGDADQDKQPPYSLTVAAAGIAASDLTLSVEAANNIGGGSVLKVAGSSTKTGAYLDRLYRLPKDAETEKAHASHVDGLLTVLIPRKAAHEPTLIVVNGMPASASVAMEANEAVMV